MWVCESIGYTCTHFIFQNRQTIVIIIILSCRAQFQSLRLSLVLVQLKLVAGQRFESGSK